MGNIFKQQELYDVFAFSKLPGQRAKVMVHSKEILNFENQLNLNQIYFNITDNNVAHSLEQDIVTNKLLRNLLPFNAEKGLSTERYYSYDEIIAYIESLALRYPKRVFVKTWGKSYEKRWIKAMTITNGDGRSGKNVILMDGGFHAREWISHASVVYAIEQLVENFENNADLLRDYDWVILPVVNPDGYEYTQQTADTRLWRKTRQPWSEACIGTDPNRNFDFHWNEEGASPDPCSQTYAGPKAFSEPETVIVRDIIHSLQGRGIMYLTIHTCGNYILYPWGWTE